MLPIKFPLLGCDIHRLLFAVAKKKKDKTKNTKNIQNRKEKKDTLNNCREDYFSCDMLYPVHRAKLFALFNTYSFLLLKC